MKILKKYLSHYRREVIGATISVLVSSFATLWQPRVLQDIQRALLANRQQAVLHDGIWLVVLGLIAIVAGIFNVYYAARIAQGVTSDLREATYQKIQGFSLENVDKFSSGSLSTRLINDMNQIMNMMMMMFMPLLRIPVLLVGSLILSIITIPRYWWAPVLMLLLIGGFGIYVVNHMNKLFNHYQKLMDKISTQVKETLQGVRVVKSFNQGKNEIKRFNKTSDELNGYNITIGYWFSAIMPAFQLIAFVIIGVVVFLIGVTIKDHPADVTVISSYVSYIMTLLFAILIGGMVAMTFSRGNVSLKRIGKVLRTAPTISYPAEKEQQLAGSVEFEHVSFTYPGNQEPTLTDLSFKIEPHEMVGIVGATGSGKTTLVNLIARLYDVDRGESKIGGQPIKDISEQTLRKTVAYVLQKAILFSGTIADNLRQGKANASLAEMERAAEIAQASEFINRYPDRFNHIVEERSANFSGGQKQRLSIARGLIAQPPILILDDSTSALDAESEKRVQKGLENDLPNTTTIMIAEKIMSVRHADKILVLEDGKLESVGTHEELLEKSPVYKAIFESQKAQEKWGDFGE